MIRVHYFFMFSVHQCLLSIKHLVQKRVLDYERPHWIFLCTVDFLRQKPEGYVYCINAIFWIWAENVSNNCIYLDNNGFVLHGGDEHRHGLVHQRSQSVGVGALQDSTESHQGRVSEPPVGAANVLLKKNICRNWNIGFPLYKWIISPINRSKDASLHLSATS